jgi:gamma-glutamyltranspeptidase/glutathione hydrolase
LATLGLACLVRLVHAEPVAGHRGMVASAHPLATQAGIQMLQAGGTACDAAVATAFTLAVVEPYSSGLGGGGFALVRYAGALHYSDFREVAPKHADPNMFIRDGKAEQGLSEVGPLAVAVPGAVAGYADLHRRCGKLPFDQVLTPAIAAAEQGFPVDLRYVSHAQSRLHILRMDKEASRIFLLPGDPNDPNGAPTVPPVGHPLVQADLAKTLRTLAQEGADSFYRGSLSKRLADSLRRGGSIMTAEDLARYRVRERQPLVGFYRGALVITAPPPSSGGQILLTLLNFMETLPQGTGWHDPAWLRTFVEGAKRAYADRALIADPDFVLDTPALLGELLAKPRALAIARTFAGKPKAAADIPAGEGTRFALAHATAPPPGSHHTTHLSVIDTAGNAVSLTSTINFSWGAGWVAAGTGVLWNDEMDDFAVDVGVPNAYGIRGSAANRVAAGKTPLSSMTPTFVLAGNSLDAPLRLVVGSPGGSRIPSSVAQVVLHVLDDNLDVRTAVHLGRIHHQHLPDAVQIERYNVGTPAESWITHAGYTVKEEHPWCNVMVIAVDPDTGLRTAAADPRGVGAAMAQ